MAGFVTTILDPVLNPLLVFSPFWIILIISLLVTILITLVYKFMTDQKLMKSLKEDMNKFREKMKEFKDHPDKMLKIQKQAMEKQMQYMMHSMKPTLITFLPIILLFGWLNAHLAFVPIMPNQDFTVTAEMVSGLEGEVSLSVTPSNDIDIVSSSTQSIEDNEAIFTLNGDPGKYQLTYEYNGQSADHAVLITEEAEYEDVLTSVKDSPFKTLKVGNEKTVLFNLFGWRVGWLAGYIIFSIVFSISLRKVLKIH